MEKHLESNARMFAQQIGMHLHAVQQSDERAAAALRQFRMDWKATAQRVEEAFTEYAISLSAGGLTAVISHEPAGDADEELPAVWLELPEIPETNGGVVVASYVVRPNIATLQVVPAIRFGDSERDLKPMNLRDVNAKIIQEQLNTFMTEVVRALNL